MEMIRRIISSGSVASGFSSRRQNSDNKLEESPPDYKDPDKVASGISFRVKYFGSTLVEELTEEGASYGDSITTKAITAIITFAFASGRKIKKVELKVSVKGIMVTDAQTHRCISNLDIHRIRFCTANKKFGKVFAYIARNTDNETMECHAFGCKKRKISQTITLTIASSFKLAQEMQNNEHEKRNSSRKPESSKMSKLLDKTAPPPSGKSELKFEDNFSPQLSIAPPQTTSTISPKTPSSMASSTQNSSNNCNFVYDLVVL